MAGFNMNEVLTSVERKFQLYRQLLHGVAKNQLRHLFIRGPQGLGKTYEAEDVFSGYVAAGRIKFHRAAGRTTPLSLYNHLHDWRRAGNIVLFDDCDTVFDDKDCLNLLKAATDTRETRTISWGSTSGRVSVPEFVYEGSMVVITNADLRRPKYAALADRIHLFDLSLTPEEKVGRIIMVLARQRHFEHVHDAVITWIISHHAQLAERLTIRTALKILELAAFNADDWRDLANATIIG